MSTPSGCGEQGKLEARGTDITAEELQGILMRNQYIWDAKQAGGQQEMLDFYAARLAEVSAAKREPGGNTRDNRDRISALVTLSQAREWRDPDGNPGLPAGFVM